MPTHTLKRAMAASTVTALAAGLLAVATGSATAATSTYPLPPYEPDANAIGTLTFYDVAGHVVTSGNTADPLPAYVIGSAASTSGATKATLFGYLPKNGQPIGAASGEALAGPTTFPIVTAPSPVKDYAYPAVAPTASDLTFANLQSDFPNTATDAYQGLYQVRIKTTDTKYQVADIKITGSTWQQVYPNFTTTTTTETIADLTDSSAPAGTATTGDSVKLSAVVAGSGAAGKVAFLDGTTVISTQPLTSGAASYTLTAAKGTHSYSAVYYPQPGSNTIESSAPAQPLDVQDPKPTSFTSVATDASPTTTDQDPVTVTATVKTPDSAGGPVTGGTVTFSDSIDGPLGSQPVSSAGVATLTRTFSAAYGTSAGHVVTAAYSNTGTYKPSSGTAPAFQVAQSGPCAQTGSQCTDPQTLKVTVATGTITISTPYHDGNPFDLDTMALSNDGQRLTASAPFGTAADPTQGVTITDRRAGDLPWDASVSAQDFVSGSNQINAQNLSFTGLVAKYVAGNALDGTTKKVDVTNLPTTTVNGYAPGAAGTDGLKGAKVFAHANKGVGTVNIIGTMGLVAPTSTVAGTYTSVVTFTIG